MTKSGYRGVPAGALLAAEEECLLARRIEAGVLAP